MEESNICVICGRTNKEANLVNAVLGREKEVSKLCEMCAFIEQAVVIPKPTKKQLEQTEIPYTVYERLLRMSGIKGKQAIPEKRVIKKEDIKLLESENDKAAIIDFSSKNLKIGDLQKLRRKVFG